MKSFRLLLALTIAASAGCASTDTKSPAQPTAPTIAVPAFPPGTPIPVTVDTFTRAESDFYFANIVKDNGFGGMMIHRNVASIDEQKIIRLNRDTLYAAQVLDLDAGPATFTLPTAGKRFISCQIISQDHYTWPAIYDSKPHTITRKQIGTRYVALAFRILVNPNDRSDLKTARALQDAIKVEQPGGPGTFTVPQWDPASQKKIRDALLVLAASVSDTSRSFGTADQVDPIQHLIGTAAAWGANPPKDATYLNGVPAKNDGTTPYVLTVKDVPVNAFWSVSVYNEKGYYEKNAANAYTFNNVTAKPNPDDSITIHFGGDEKATNYLPISPGWNYTVRLYRPRAEITDGRWKFPEAKPAP